MTSKLTAAAFLAAAWIEASASVAALTLVAVAPSAAAAQDNGSIDPETIRRNLKLVKDLERGLREAEAARLKGDCDRLETLRGLFYGFHMQSLPADTAADFQRRWREISDQPCPPETAAPPPPLTKPDEAPPTPVTDAPPAEDIPTYDAEPAPPGFGNKPPTVGVPYRDPNDPMIIPLPPPKKMETDPPPPKKADAGASQQQEECEEGGQCEIGRDGNPKRREKRPR